MAKAKAKAPTAGWQENFVVRYVNETRAELRKVTWPTRQQAWNLTLIVLAATVVMAAFLGVLALLFQSVVAGIVRGEWLWIGVAVVTVVATGVAFVYNSRTD